MTLTYKERLQVKDGHYYPSQTPTTTLSENLVKFLVHRKGTLKPNEIKTYLP